MSRPPAQGPAAGTAQPKPIAPGRPRVAVTEAAISPRVPRTGTEHRPAALAGTPAAPESLQGAQGVAAGVPGLRAGGSPLAAQAVYVHASCLGLNIATACVCLLFAWLWSQRGWVDALTPWLALGALSVALRLGVQLGWRPRTAQALTDGQARRLLALASLAALASGLMMGWGWLSAIPRDSDSAHEVFLIAQFGLMLWSLHALRPFLPAFLGFVVTSMGPALSVTVGLQGTGAGSPGLTLSLLVLTLIAVGFGVRAAQQFRAAQRLQARVQRLLEEVTANRDEAVRATQAKSRFLASVSHDLRQPMHAMNLYLSAVAGYFEQLRASPADTAAAGRVQEGLRSLRHSVLYLNSMFESLLDISRLNAGTVAVEIRYTSLGPMLAQLESDYSRQAASQGLRFELQRPAQIDLMEVETDPALLERLLRNLLVNAFRYTPAGGVRLALRPQGRRLDFRVVDTGPGIERSMRTRVFEEFFQVPETPGAAGAAGARAVPAGTPEGEDDAPGPLTPVAGRGIGLGLSISARLADKLGSRIRLHSHRGHGSVFAISQPMRITLRPQEQVAPAPRDRGAALPPGLFVAVIEDDRGIRHATRQMLEVLGAEVFTAESAVQAVRHLGVLGRKPGLIVSDFRLGGHNGVQAIAMLREEFNDEIPALLVTGDTSPDQVEELRRLGLTVLFKPVASREMLAAMRDVLHNRARGGQDPG